MSFKHYYTYDLHGLWNFLLTVFVLTIFLAQWYFNKSYQKEHGVSKKEANNAIKSIYLLFKNPPGSVSLRKSRLVFFFYFMPMSVLLIYVGYVLRGRNG
jgi:hypothetical protein